VEKNFAEERHEFRQRGPITLFALERQVPQQQSAFILEQEEGAF
jgi:hypothetical protein